jgi:SAM-dependent methyltransferase
VSAAIFGAYAHYYDLLYRDKDYDGEAAFVQALLAEQGLPSGSILELGCGTGRHAVQLARRGYEVAGYDSSPAMIAEARSNAPPALGSCLKFEVGDARTLDLGRKVGAVLALFHVASYHVDNESVAQLFATAARHLHPGGVFLFDYWYGPAVLVNRPAIRIKRLATTELEIIRIAEPCEQAEYNSVVVDYTILAINKLNRQTEEIHESHRLRYFFMPELQLMLSNAGFEESRRCEWMTGKPLSTATWSATTAAVKA